MYSVAFPKMFSSSSTNLVYGHEATAQNLLLTLKSDRESLFGDPYFGTLLKRMLFEQSNMLIQDLVIDEIYSTITTFIPQIDIRRGDITLRVENTAIFATIKCINKINHQIDLFSIKLTEDDDV